MNGTTRPIAGSEKKKVMTLLFGDNDWDALVIEALGKKLPEIPTHGEFTPGLYANCGTGSIQLILVRE